MNKGKLIRQRREELQMSLTDLAKRVGVSKQTLYKYEHNIVTNIPSDNLENIAKVLGVSPGYLMGWTPMSVTVSGHTPPDIVFIGDDNDIVFEPDSLREENKAYKLYEMYTNASPEIQQAVDAILKSSQPKP